MRVSSLRSVALALLTTAGCSFDWDTFQGPRPGADGGVDVATDLAVDTPADAPVDTGPECTPERDTCPTGRYCVPGVNQCATGCRNDNDCSALGDGGVAQRCDTASHVCVACANDTHCPLGQLCMGNTCVAGCNAARGCPAGRTCCAGGCVDAQSNTQHCGACGSVCSVANATPSCIGGQCGVEMCRMGFGDCDRSANNGCETDVTTSTLHCGGCGVACPVYPRAAAVCAAGRCSMGACETGFADCDGNAVNGCEVNLRADTANCGACGMRCSFPGAGAACTSGVCVRTTCSPGFGDCDGDPSACEVTFASDAANCGRCGNACSFAHATGVCTSGVCALGRCESGWGDCDGMAANGCETDLNLSATNCGACGNACAFNGGTGVCRMGMCALATCDTGRDNCDGVAANGCEVDVRSNLSNCGACGRPCVGRPNSVAYCASAACGFTCESGFDNCDRVESNGCEVNLRTSNLHCGGCGLACAPANGSGACNSGTCEVTNCNAGFGNCDGNPTNGCETDTTSSMSHCGACGRTCAPANGTGVCRSGSCQLTACTGTFGNCDGSAANGCETDLVSDNNNCGACGLRCAAGTTCLVGRCSEPTFAGYTVTTPPPEVTWIDACAAPGGINVLVGEDDGFIDGALPFPVWLWGGSNQHYLVNSNGLVGFGTLFYNITAVPDRAPFRAWASSGASRVAPAVYLFGVDLVLGPSGVCIATVGTAPNRRWVAEFFNAELYVSSTMMFGPSQYTFELQAYEANRNLDVLYNTPFTTPFGLTPTSPDPILVAVQDYRPTTYTNAALYSSGMLSATTRVRFAPR